MLLSRTENIEETMPQIQLWLDDDVLETLQELAQVDGLTVGEKAEDLIEMALFKPKWEEYPGVKEI